MSTTLPLAFARRHGVLVQSVSGGAAHGVMRADVAPTALAEARRHLRLPLRLSQVSDDAFDALLRSGDGAESADFYNAKLQTAEFYFERLLPRAQAHARSALAP
ncbi:MAG: hypothetical protein EBR15_09785, partial [Gammaproteobacteria bacterium]|nr:hypothetical protein [Gammaproteobacteria bacterium]